MDLWSPESLPVLVKQLTLYAHLFGFAFGIVLVYFDIGFDVTLLLDRPKLLSKLAIVAVLTLNGIVLHNVAFPMLTRPQRRPRVATAIDRSHPSRADSEHGYARRILGCRLHRSD